MKLLIINADDYGISPSVNRGILEMHQRGVVTSTSVMIGMPGAAEALQHGIAQAPQLGFGLHLVLAGKNAPPVLSPDQIPSLVREDGQFFDEPVWHQRTLDADDIHRELEAQIKRFVEAAGRLPTHLDSHYHAAYRYPAAVDALCELAARYGLPIRNPGFTINTSRSVPTHPTHFFGVEHDKTTVDSLIDLLRQLPDGVSELMVHPGYVDDVLAHADNFTHGREAEIQLLSTPAVIEAFAAVPRGTFADAFRTGQD